MGSFAGAIQISFVMLFITLVICVIIIWAKVTWPWFVTTHLLLKSRHIKFSNAPWVEEVVKEFELAVGRNLPYEPDRYYRLRKWRWFRQVIEIDDELELPDAEIVCVWVDITDRWQSSNRDKLQRFVGTMYDLPVYFLFREKMYHGHIY